MGASIDTIKSKARMRIRISLQSISKFAITVETLFFICLTWFSMVHVIGSEFPLYRVTSLILCLLAAFVIVTRKKVVAITASTFHVVLTGIFLILILFVIDLAQNDRVQGVEDALIRLINLMLLPAAEILRLTDEQKIRRYILIAIVPLLFGALQAIGYRITMPEIWPSIPFTGVSVPRGMALAFMQRSNRIVGSFVIPVTYGIFLGGLLVLVLFYLGGIKRWILTIGIVILTYMTGTRSAFYGIGIILALWALYRIQGYSRKLVGVLISSVAVTAILLFGIFLLSSNVSGTSRLAVAMDVNTTVKLFSSYVGIVDTWKVSPIFGIPKAALSQSIMRSYSLAPALIGDYDLAAAVTNHNQVVWFFRYYGLLGLGFAILWHLMVWKKIMQKRSGRLRWALASMLIYLFQYSLLHNNFTAFDPTLLLFLAIVGRADRIQPDSEQALVSETGLNP